MTEQRNRRNGSSDDRSPPHNLEAEAAALGAALLSPQAADAIVGIVDAADFYTARHQHIAAAILELHSADVMVDVITVSEQLRQQGMLTVAGGLDYLNELLGAAPSTSNARQYARAVRNASMFRRIIATAGQIAEVAYSNDGDPAAALSKTNDLVASLGTVDTAALSNLFVADIVALHASGLIPEEAVLLRRVDGQAVLYAGKMHTFQAEPGAGKTWLGLYAVAEVLYAGGTAAMLDYEDTANTALLRLRTIGVPAHLTETRFLHISPGGKLGAAERADLWTRLDALNPDLVVIDGVANALTAEGLSEDVAPDFVKWVGMLPRPIARSGAAVLMLDHVAKDPEQRGRWARGTGAKLGEIDGAAYQLKVRVPFSKRRAGITDIVVAKDRPGGVGTVGETVARVHFEPHAAGEQLSIRVDAHAVDVNPGDSWKPTVIMGKLWQALDESTVPLSAAALKALVHSDKPRLLTEALQRLIAEGYIVEGRSGRSKVLQIARPYDGAEARPAAPSWRQPPPPDLFDAADEPSDLSWIDDRYLDQLEHHANGTNFYNREDF